jgi:hypothetical protein
VRSCRYFDLPLSPCTSPLWIALLDFSVWTCLFPLFKTRSVLFGIQPLSWIEYSASWGPQLAPAVFAFHQQGMRVWTTRPRFVFFLRQEFRQKTASLHHFLVLRKIEIREKLLFYNGRRISIEVFMIPRLASYTMGIHLLKKRLSEYYIKCKVC